MTKRNAALEAIGGAARVAEPAPAVETSPAVPEAPKSEPTAKPAGKSGDQTRVMLYTHPKVARKFKEIAFIENRKANDVYLEALDQYLTKQGHGGLKGVIER